MTLSVVLVAILGFFYGFFKEKNKVALFDMLFDTPSPDTPQNGFSAQRSLKGE